MCLSTERGGRERWGGCRVCCQQLSELSCTVVPHGWGTSHVPSAVGICCSWRERRELLRQCFPATFPSYFSLSARQRYLLQWSFATHKKKRQDANQWQTMTISIVEAWRWCIGSAATAQTYCSYSCLARLSLSHHPVSNFPSPWSEISHSDVFFPTIPWLSSWLLCVERRWLQAVRALSGRSPGAGERVGPCLCSGGGPVCSGVDARGKDQPSPPQPWTRPWSLLCVAPG